MLCSVFKAVLFDRNSVMHDLPGLCDLAKLENYTVCVLFLLREIIFQLFLHRYLTVQQLFSGFGYTFFPFFRE